MPLLLLPLGFSGAESEEEFFGGGEAGAAFGVGPSEKGISSDADGARDDSDEDDEDGD